MKAKIDLEKFICSLMERYYEKIHIDPTTTKCWLDSVLEDQGLEYKDGEIVEIEQESEGERIKKEILELVSISGNGNQFEEIKDWLEKQASKPKWSDEDEEPKRDSLILLIMQSGTPVVAKIIEPNHTFNHGEKWAYIDDLIFNQGEQKPANKVEPKFHEGDWITNGRYNKLIVGINSDWPYYIFEDGTSQHIKYIDKKYHLWTIADAKPCDVLTSSYGQPFIYNGYYNSYNVGAYGGLCCIGDEFMFSPTGKYWTNNIGIHPATKEQRDLLFQKMKEAGWKWDKEKKGLKKIEED